MKKVVKFGGSSLANADQFKKVGAIISEDEARRYVVPSAPGKRFSNDIKVTDMLYACYESAVNGSDFTEQLAQIKERYQEIIDGLNLSFSLESDFEKIREQGYYYVDKTLLIKELLENAYTAGEAPKVVNTEEQLCSFKWKRVFEMERKRQYKSRVGKMPWNVICLKREG